MIDRHFNYIFIFNCTNGTKARLSVPLYVLRKCYAFINVWMRFVDKGLCQGHIYFPSCFSIFNQVTSVYSSYHISVLQQNVTLSPHFFSNTQSSLAKWFAPFPREPFRTFFGSSHLVPYLFPTRAGLHLRFLSSHWTICFLLLSSRQIKIWLYFGELPSLLDSSNHLSCRPFFDSIYSLPFKYKSTYVSCMKPFHTGFLASVRMYTSL